MRSFKTREFAKSAMSEGLTDKVLAQALAEIRNGLVNAKLGGSLVKKRIAIGNKGKSGGLRTIIVYKTPNENAFCVYIFAKNETENISQRQLAELKLLAKSLLAMNEKQIQNAIKTNALEELIYEENEETSEKL